MWTEQINEDNAKGLFGWGKRPSMANLQAPALQPYPPEDRASNNREPAIHKKKSFGLFKSMAKRSETAIDVRDESVSICVSTVYVV